MKPYFLILFGALLHVLSACSGNDASADPALPTTTDAVAFDSFHQASEKIYDGNGSWGLARYGYRMALRDSYWRADVYRHLAARSDLSTPLYAQRAHESLQYLLLAQSQGGTGVFGFPADVNNPEFGSTVQRVIDVCPSCLRNGWVIDLPGRDVAELYYDHGNALASVARAYERTGDAALLAPIKEAADWILNKPLTTNINYLSALSKGLCHAYRATGNALYLDQAIAFHRDGILPLLNENGEARDAHNAQLEYHGFIVSGMIALRQSLPPDHPDRAWVESLDQALARALTRMASRDLQENGDYGVTWPGTNLLAWHELSLYRPLTLEEGKARDRVRALIRGYSGRVGTEGDGFRLRKALYSYFFVGLSM